MASIRELRQQAGLSQKRLAERSRLSLWRVSSIEQGYLAPHPEEERLLRQVVADAMRERNAAFLAQLREA